MSTVFVLHCETCNVDGPKIRRSGSTTLCGYSITGPFDDQFKAAANEVWTHFLADHEFHDLRLATGP